MRVLRYLCDKAIDLCLGCRHDRLTRPFTIEAESYMVCLNCGRQLFYSLETMRRISGRELRRMRAARGQGLTPAVTPPFAAPPAYGQAPSDGAQRLSSGSGAAVSRRAA